jgi:hypothetical protein
LLLLISIFDLDIISPGSLPSPSVAVYLGGDISAKAAHPEKMAARGGIDRLFDALLEPKGAG